MLRKKRYCHWMSETIQQTRSWRFTLKDIQPLTGLLILKDKRMKKFILLTIVLFISPLKNFSQTVLLREDRDHDTVQETFGPNLKDYAHIILGYGLVFGESGKEFPVKGGSSNEFHVGV